MGTSKHVGAQPQGLNQKKKKEQEYEKMNNKPLHFFKLGYKTRVTLDMKAWKAHSVPNFGLGS